MMIEDRYYICRIRQFFQEKKSNFFVFITIIIILLLYREKKKQAKERVVGGVWVSGSVVYETRVI